MAWKTTLSLVGSIPWLDYVQHINSVRDTCGWLKLRMERLVRPPSQVGAVRVLSLGHVHARLHLCWYCVHAARDVGHRRPLPLRKVWKGMGWVPGRLRLLLPVVVFRLRLLHLEHDGGLKFASRFCGTAVDAGSVSALKHKRARSLRFIVRSCVGCRIDAYVDDRGQGHTGAG